MTIAACYVSNEGVVLGADSTSTISARGQFEHYLNNEQKLFEVGEGGSLGVVTWGRGAFGTSSHRALVATLADKLSSSKPKTVEEAAGTFSTLAWNAFNNAFASDISSNKAIIADPDATPEAKNEAAQILDAMSTGFCIGGTADDHVPAAYTVTLTHNLSAAPAPQLTKPIEFWGADLFVYRVLGFTSARVKNDILATGKWSGTPDELTAAINKSATPIIDKIPLREAIDMVHALLQMTVKVMKFTSLPPVCGGHIEIGVVTADRNFRWVRHKPLSAALDNP